MGSTLAAVPWLGQPSCAQLLCRRVKPLQLRELSSLWTEILRGRSPAELTPHTCLQGPHLGPINSQVPEEGGQGRFPRSQSNVVLAPFKSLTRSVCQPAVLCCSVLSLKRPASSQKRKVRDLPEAEIQGEALRWLAARPP